MRLFPIAVLAALSITPIAAAADDSAAPGIVRLHIASPVPVQLTEHRAVAGTHYGNVSVTTYEEVRLLCFSPCDQLIDGRSGNAFSIATPEESIPDPPRFGLAKMRGDVQLTVEPGSKLRMNLGRLLAGVGGVAFFFGAVSVPMSLVGRHELGGGPVTPGEVAYWVSLVGGGAALGGGIALVLGARTKLRFEPRPGGLALSLATGALW